jgi:hypothetical protein
VALDSVFITVTVTGVVVSPADVGLGVTTEVTVVVPGVEVSGSEVTGAGSPVTTPNELVWVRKDST